MEPIEEINKHLLDNYGYFAIDTPNFRVVFSDDQYEKRFGTFEDYNGAIFIRRVEEVREVPKYWHVKERYILERAMPILTPDAQKELVNKKFDYYVVWTFETGDGKALPPKYAVCYYVIETIYANAAARVGVAYKHPYWDKKINPEVRKAKLEEIEEYLYGNESSIGDSLQSRAGVGFTKEAKLPFNFEYIAQGDKQ